MTESNTNGVPLSYRKDKIYPNKTTSLTWAQANTICTTADTSLASVHDAVDNNELKTFFTANNCDCLWIGGSDSVIENTWVWADQSPFDYYNWKEMTIDDIAENEDQLAIIDGEGKWDDKKADENCLC